MLAKSLFIILTVAFSLAFGQNNVLMSQGTMPPPLGGAESAPVQPPQDQQMMPPPQEQGQMAPQETQEPLPNQQVQPSEEQLPPQPEEEKPVEEEKPPEEGPPPPPQPLGEAESALVPPPEEDIPPPPPGAIYNPPLIKPEEIPQEELNTYIEENKIEQPLGFVDTDKDGLSDQHEFYMGTDPQVGDSDGDGFEDGKEVLQFGTNPNETSTQPTQSGPKVVNFAPEETVEAGPQFILGQAQPGEVIKLYEKNEVGELILLGETTADDEGAYALLSDAELSEGKHDLVLGDSSFTLNVAEPEVKTPVIASAGIEVGAVLEAERPVLTLKPTEEALIVVTWQSTVYSQTLIADSSGQTVNIEPPADLGPGEHTVTWYSQNLETGQKSQPTQIAFTVTSPITPAFVTGETGGLAPWKIATIGAGTLLILTMLSLVLRKRK